MDEAKALLDSLMGTSRNKAGKERKNDEFMEKNVCKFYLVCWCPNEWFTSTRRAQKECTKVHSDHLKEQFEQHPEHKKYRIRYEKEFLRHLEFMIAEADNCVTREKRKCRSAGKEVKIPVELRAQYDELEKEYSKLLEEADKAASESLMQQADAKKTQIDTLKKLHTVDSGGEEVCEVCGARYPIKPEADPSINSHSWFEHAEGKVHKGFLTIREKHKEIKEKLRQEENNQEDEKRVRSRSRHRNGEKKDAEKNGDDKEDKTKNGAEDDGKKDNRKNDRTDDRRDDRKDDRRRDKDDRRDDRSGRRSSPRRDDRRGDDRGRRRRDDSRDRDRRRR